MNAVVQVQGAQQAKSDLQSVGKSSDSAQNSFGGLIKQGLATATSFAIFNVGAKAVGFLKDQLADTITVAIQHQQIMAQTAQVIKSTGDASGLTAQSISDLATSLSQVTPFSEDAIQSGENLLLTFTGIGKDVFPQATKTLLDMSQAMGGDTKSAAIQLGKALNDPATGLTALTRVGVTFSDSQKEAIKSMVAAGNTAGAQKIMLAELQKEFGGSAEAAGKTFGGQLQILQNDLEDTKQKIGTALLPILGQLVTSVAGMVMPAIQKFGDFLQSPAFQQFASGVGQQIVAAFKNIGSFVKTDVVPAVNDFIGVIKSPQFADFVNKLKDLGSTLGSVVGPAFSGNTPVVKDLFNFVKTTAIPALSGLVEALTNTVKWLRDHGSAVSFVASLITALYVPALIKAGVEAAIAGAKTAAGFIANVIKVGVEGFQAGAKLLTFTINIIQTGAEAAMAGIKIGINFVGSIIKSGIESAIAGTKVAISFVANIVKAGIESAIAGAKVAGSFITSIIAAGTESVISGAKVAGSFIVSLISAGVEAVTSGAIIMASIVPALLATAAGALATAAPFILIGLVIAAVVIGIVLAIQHWAQITAWFQGVWTVVWGAVSSFFVGIWNDIIKFLQNAWNFIVNAAKIGASLLLAMIIGPIGLLAFFIFQHWDQIKVATGVLFNTVVNFFAQLPGNIMNFLQSLPGKIMNLWNNIITDAKNAGLNIVKGIADGITGAIHFVTDAITNVTSWISAHLPHSPAKVGPLMHLADQGAEISNQIAMGMINGMPMLNGAINNLLKPISVKMNPLQGGMTGLPSGTTAIPSSSSNNQIVIENYHYHYLDGKKITDNTMKTATKTIRQSGPLRSTLS
jgi:hypothetical protein